MMISEIFPHHTHAHWAGSQVVSAVAGTNRFEKLTLLDLSHNNLTACFTPPELLAREGQGLTLKLDHNIQLGDGGVFSVGPHGLSKAASGNTGTATAAVTSTPKPD